MYVQGDYAVDSDSVFDGDIKIDTLKMVEDDDTWTPEFWAATGVLNIESEVNFEGTVDVEYRKSDGDLGETFTINEAEIATSSDNSMFSADAEAKALDVVITKSRNDIWELQRWTAIGKLGFDIDGLSLGAEVEVAYSIGELEDEPSSFVVKKATMQASDEGIVEANAEVSDLLISQSETGSWVATQWDAKGRLAFDTEAIQVETDVLLNYRNEEDKQTYTIDTAQLDLSNPDSSSLLTGSVEISDVVISREQLESASEESDEDADTEAQVTSEKGDWVLQTWKASSAFNTTFTGLGLNSEVNLAYFRNGSTDPSTGATYDVDTAIVEDTFISIDAQDSIFSTSANINKLKVTKDDKDNWLPEYWDVSGELDLDLDGLGISGSVNAEYYRAGSEVPEATLELPAIGSSNGTINSIDDSEISANEEDNSLLEDSGSEADEIGDDGSTDISSESVDNIFESDAIFTSGSFDVNSDTEGTSDSIFNGQIDLAQLKITKEKDETWSPEFWQASGTLGIDLNGLDITGTVDAAYYRAGTAVPGSVLTLPDIGSSNEIDASTGTDIDATSDADTDAALSRETTTETPASDQASENEEIIADQTTEEIADDETFDVDTIFTSGTFEIAAGGGNPDDSIFQGEINSLK